MNRFILFFSFFLFVSSALAADYVNRASNIARTRHKTLGRRQGPTTGATTTSTTSTTVTPSSSSATASSKPSIRAAWVADWVPFDNITWGSYTMLTYAFGVTTPDPTNITVNSTGLTSFVKTAKEKNVKAFLSLGGSQGSLYFSPHCATAESRTIFVQTIVKLVTDYGLDGIDFDWEFPNGPGLPCNKVDANDTDNYVALLQELRKALKDDDKTKNVGLSAAVGMLPFNDKAGNARTDVSDFAEVLDHVAIMAYDVFGSWSNNQTGPNAPLMGDACMPNTLNLTADSSVNRWKEAHMPLDKIVLGVAAYGRSFGSLQGSLDVDDTSKNVTNYPHFGSIPQGYQDVKDGEGPRDACGAPPTHSGVFTFEGLIESGYLHIDGLVNASRASYVFDNCTKTPFLQDKDKGILISYDDRRSFGEKGRWIVEKELAGFAMWHAANDYHGLLAGAVTEPFLTS